MSAPAITYTVDGEQYVAVAAAFGGSGGLGATGDPQHRAAEIRQQPGPHLRIQTSAATEIVQALAIGMPENVPKPPDEKIDPELASQGLRRCSTSNCAVCHGVLMLSSGEVPDLRSVLAGDLGAVRRYRAGRRAGRCRHGLVQGPSQERRRGGDPRLYSAAGPDCVGCETEGKASLTFFKKERVHEMA